jgi:hypothetical protein
LTIGVNVRTDVPYGNAGEISVVEREGLAEVHVCADPHGGPERLWFCFRVEWHGGVAQPVAWVLEHVGNMLGGDRPKYITAEGEIQ